MLGVPALAVGPRDIRAPGELADLLRRRHACSPTTEGPLTLEQYLKAVRPHVREEGTCWIWTGRIQDGIPRMPLAGRVRSVWTVAYEARNGPMPQGHLPGRSCGRMCVNPEHIFAETRSSAGRRSWQTRRARGSYPCRRT